MADLNGDGVPDLVAADSARDRILVYLGLGDGQFGPELYGGDGVAAGIDPVGVSVADLNGDGRPDLIVANERSNDVTILMNVLATSSNPLGLSAQQQITFEVADTIHTGSAPVSAVVGTDGAGQRYLAVADSGSNDVMIFLMTASGTFSGIADQVIPLGHSPSLLIPMQWDGQPALVSLDRGDNDISLITRPGEPSAEVQTIGSGGLNPVAAESFSSGGSSGLIVANSEDGSIAIFVTSSDGLEMTSTFDSANIILSATPSLAGGGNLGAFLFAPNSGAGTSALFGFRLIGQTLTPNIEAIISLTPQNQLQPLRQSDLSLLSTLLPVSVHVTPVDARAGTLAAAPIAASDGSTIALNQSGRGNTPPKDSDPASTANVAGDGESYSVTALSAPAAPGNSGPAWEKYVSGVDEAIERLHKETIERAALSPSAAEATTASRLPAGAAVTGQSDESLVRGALSVSTTMGFKPDALYSLSVPGMTSTRSGPAVSGEGVSPADSGRTVVEKPIWPEDSRASAKERGRNRSLGLRAMVAAATIAPGVLAGLVGSTTAKRRGSRRSIRDRDVRPWPLGR
jgi:hypothetical protein